MTMSTQDQWAGQATDQDPSTTRMRHWGASRSCDPFGDDSFQGPTGACDGRAGFEVRLITSGPSDEKLVSEPCQVVPRPIYTCCVYPHI